MIIVYEPNSGRITQTVNDPVPAGLPAVLEENGLSFISVEGEFGIEVYSDYFVQNGELTPRPRFSFVSQDITLTAGESHTFKNLPKPCSIFLDEEEHQIEDGKLTITADMPAVYEIRFAQEPFREEIVRITINEA